MGRVGHKVVYGGKKFTARHASTPVAGRGDGACVTSSLNKAATNVARDLVSWLAEPGRL